MWSKLVCYCLPLSPPHPCRGLKNDSSRETFRLSHHTSDGASLFPCRFVKVVPLQCWGSGFNFSIWFLALSGDDSDETVLGALAWHNEVWGEIYDDPTNIGIAIGTVSVATIVVVGAGVDI